MEMKEFRAIKARMAYQQYISQLPRCDLCESCIFVSDRKNERRVCLETHELIENCVKTCPMSCPKREENRI